MGAKAKPVHVTASEAEVLRALMRDLQVTAAWYHAKTGTGADVADLGLLARAFLSTAQTLNERLSVSIGDAPAYVAALSNSADADLIEAVKYARNAASHVLHVVRPDDDMALIGGIGTLRLYTKWGDVPPAAHATLRTGTQALRPAFETRMLGQSVVPVMLEVLRTLGELVPDIVHRDDDGEWTGFPLMSQAAVAEPIHPDEPSDTSDGLRWLVARPPRGDARVIVGQATVDDLVMVYGYTFAGDVSYLRFVETAAQVESDIDGGFPYLVGDPAGHLSPAPAEMGPTAWRATSELSEWASPALAPLALSEDWGPHLTDDGWRRVMRDESTRLPVFVRYGVRRTRRLQAHRPAAN